MKRMDVSLPWIKIIPYSLGIQAGVVVQDLQSNDLATLKTAITTARDDGYAAIVINPGGFVAMPDSDLGFQEVVKAAGIPVVEVHYGNPLSRYVQSPLAPAAKGMVCGLGVQRYVLLTGVQFWVVAHGSGVCFG
jgi:3-dehydroquinate dehydratase II